MPKKNLDAGDAAWAIVEYLEKGKSTQGYIGGYSDENIVGSSSSRNIPLLRAAADLIKASYANNHELMRKQEQAWIKYTTGTLMWGEDISPIYLRWIALPVLIANRVFIKHDYAEGAISTSRWLKSLVALMCLGSGSARSFKGSAHAKHPHTVLKGIPVTTIVGARGWCSAKRNGTRYGPDGKPNNLQWIDGMPMCSWLQWALREIGPGSIQGGDGWTKRVMKGLQKRFTAETFLSDPEITDLRSVIAAISIDYDRDAFSRVIEMVTVKPQVPLTIVKKEGGNAYSFFEKTFKDGSTGFCHAKVYRSGYLEGYSCATPARRTNSWPARASYNRHEGTLLLVPNKGKSWSWEKNKMVDGPVEVPLPQGVSLWELTIRPNSVEPPPDEPDKEPPVEDSRLDQLVDFIVDYLEKNGILEKIVEKILERVLEQLVASQESD